MGFHMNEVMTGQHEFEPAFGDPGKRPMEFRVRWGTEDLLGWLNPRGDRFMLNDLEGTVTIDGLCVDEPCRGTLALRYLADQTLRYTFEFQVAGVPYRYVGKKVHLRPWNLAWSHTTCFGHLVRSDTGALVSTSITHFRWRDVPAFLASMRFA
jgi:hypothetical protein